MLLEIPRRLRARLHLQSSCVQPDGRIRCSTHQEIRNLVHRLPLPDHAPPPGRNAAYLAGLAVELEAMDLMIEEFRTAHPGQIAAITQDLRGTLGGAKLDQRLADLVAEYPPPSVETGEIDAEEYARLNPADTAVRYLLLHLRCRNPAHAPYADVMTPPSLDTAADPALKALLQRLDRGPAFGPETLPLMTVLAAPARHAPEDLVAQLEYIRDTWGAMLGDLVARIQSILDMLREETKARPGGPGRAEVYSFSDSDGEPENFSLDQDWMGHLVLIAKHTLVWLHQLSVLYREQIQRLDQIPDEELDRLAAFGFTGLWLIGIWKRSPASRTIKRWTGNPEAESSAYAVTEYVVDPVLGGASSMDNLRHRCAMRSIRMACDMVPNHTAIDSPWVVEHPSWFVTRPDCPFPSYSFSGVSLSEDDRVDIYLEDHYFSRSDAAVVFKRVDRAGGDECYVYHGNDGTTMPWNDTAQIDFLNREAREAVISQIVDVARRFPIIRLDAAMVLAKKHFHRLWYPEPGSGGDIPSRAEFGLSRADLDAQMPAEFWREVVDRVAAEAPDTLLLAEAFWLMEGYFVRTLGMHRVYNTAFMNMLRDEDNAGYRQVIKNTLEFDPEILRRFVNFMNNPDEETSVAQFGKGDKYFGICVLLATLPGLPMFGHGQIEGLAEKYGMEYSRAYHDEPADRELMARHEREIAGLLRNRRLFADTAQFRLYDLFTSGGTVNEDVFGYSNRLGEQFALVVYHNRYAEAQGWLQWSAGFRDPSDGEHKRTRVIDDLGVRPAPGTYCLFRDHITGQQFLRATEDLSARGLFVHLCGYRYHVFLDWHTRTDDRLGHLALVEAHLDGGPTSSIEDAIEGVFHAPLRKAFTDAVALPAEQARKLLIEEAARLYRRSLPRKFPALPVPASDPSGAAPAVLAARVFGLTTALADLLGWESTGDPDDADEFVRELGLEQTLEESLSADLPDQGSASLSLLQALFSTLWLSRSEEDLTRAAETALIRLLSTEFPLEVDTKGNLSPDGFEMVLDCLLMAMAAGRPVEPGALATCKQNILRSAASSAYRADAMLAAFSDR